MTDEKSPAPPDLQTVIAQIEGLRGQLGDARTEHLLDGARRLFERSKPPLEDDDDPVLSGTEVTIIAMVIVDAVKQREGFDFVVPDDLKNSNPAVYERARQIDRDLASSRERKVSEVLTLCFEFFFLVNYAPTGVSVEVYLECLAPLVDSLRPFYNEAQLNALVEKIKVVLGGRFQS